MVILGGRKNGILYYEGSRKKSWDESRLSRARETRDAFSLGIFGISLARPHSGEEVDDARKERIGKKQVDLSTSYLGDALGCAALRFFCATSLLHFRGAREKLSVLLFQEGEQGRDSLPLAASRGFGLTEGPRGSADVDEELPWRLRRLRRRRRRLRLC